MKILLSALACNPFQGSESFFGWSAAQCLGRDHDLWVVTSGRNEPDIKKAEALGLVTTNVRFVYAGHFTPWHPNRLLARVQSWREASMFADDSLRFARELHRNIRFDIVHHVTYSTWRVASPMWKLGVPFVLGPLAGNEPFPFRLLPILSLAAASFELTRKTSNLISPLMPAARQSIRKADHVFAITEESERFLGAIRRSSKEVTRLSAGFYSPDRAEGFARFVKTKNSAGTLRLYAAGNLGGQKCISIAFRGLSLAKKRGVNFIYHLGSDGPEISHLKELARKLDLLEEILFGGPMSREEYQNELGRTHIYLLPSMRETVGLTMMEAMLAGCVPIVADNGGPRVCVTAESGYKIAVTNSRRMAEDIGDLIVMLDGNRSVISEKGRKASERIMEAYSEEHYRTTVGAVYRQLAGK